MSRYLSALAIPSRSPFTCVLSLRVAGLFSYLLGALALIFCSPSPVHADAVLLLAEPYGRFGSVNPTGHAAVYLTRVCASDPTTLRRCAVGEAGVVISRYHRVAGLDWVAIPLIPYLYAVDRAEQVPESADARTVLRLRNEYRAKHLSALVPNTGSGNPPTGDWTQLVGASYDRRIVALRVKTTPEQDDALIVRMNARENAVQFNLLFRNCANFAAEVLNDYFPGAVSSRSMADLWLATPKHVGQSLARFGGRRPELQLSGFVIPQIPGSRSRSRKTRGVLESLVKTKKYAIPLAIVQPWVPTGFAAGYLVRGRFNPRRYTTATQRPAEIEQHAVQAAQMD
ncbi:MAG: hypothetical protein AB7Q29_01240 [Vicinamibacterales bacterium]